MICLALDTALDACSAALLRDGVVLAEETRDIGRGHAEVLMAVVETVLDGARLGILDCDRFAVTVGPGSFTGIRVGLAAARGFAVAAGRPVVGVSTLEALAADAGAAGPVLAVIDARRDEVYAGLFGPTHEAGGPPRPLGSPAAL
jgi:tRNA threonylcarbamoyladenosine biosynthesis protein TsaB